MSALTNIELPRQLADNVWWLSKCAPLPPLNGLIVHGYASLFLVSGTERSIIVEGGDPDRLDLINDQLDELIARAGLPPVEYVFVTHGEPPHSSGLGVWLEKFPEARLVGDVRDYHLYFPTLADRFVRAEIGARFDLGGTEFVIVDPVIRDLAATQWGFDTASKTLFPGDGFAYSHYHEAGQCGHVAEEAPEIAFSEMTATFAERALYWMVFTDMEPYIERLRKMIFDDLHVELIAPTHGMPITDPAATCPVIFEGLRQSSTVMS